MRDLVHSHCVRAVGEPAAVYPLEGRTDHYATLNELRGAPTTRTDNLSRSETFIGRTTLMFKPSGSRERQLHGRHGDAP